MARRDFDRWVQRACGYIYYPPDRESIKQELLWHLEDTAEALTEEGMDETEAEAAALEAMGSADEVGRLLRRVHKPWLGWLCRISRIFVPLLCIVLALSFLSGNGELLDEAEHLFRGRADAGDVAAVVLTGREIYAEELHPSGKVRCGDYSFSVSQVWRITDVESGKDYLGFVLSYSSPRFWLGLPAMSLRAVESDGDLHPEMLYYNSEDIVPSVDTELEVLWCVLRSYSQTAFGEYLCLTELSGDAQWVDVIQSRGEGFDIRIYLTEGGAA